MSSSAPAAGRTLSYPRCGAKTRTGGSCGHPAGARTDHPRQGRCWMHGGRNPIRSGRYSRIERPRIRELIERHEGDTAPLDLLPELAAARALFEDFVERYDGFVEALLAWHASFGAEGEEGPDGEPLPRPTKPRQVLDISDARQLLGEITRIAKRIEDVRSQDAVSRTELLRILTEMGRGVDLVVDDEGQRRRIKDYWSEIRLA